MLIVEFVYAWFIRKGLLTCGLANGAFDITPFALFAAYVPNACESYYPLSDVSYLLEAPASSDGGVLLAYLYMNNKQRTANWFPLNLFKDDFILHNIKQTTPYHMHKMHMHGILYKDVVATSFTLSHSMRLFAYGRLKSQFSALSIAVDSVMSTLRTYFVCA